MGSSSRYSLMSMAAKARRRPATAARLFPPRVPLTACQGGDRRPGPADGHVGRRMRGRASRGCAERGGGAENGRSGERQDEKRMRGGLVHDERGREKEKMKKETGTKTRATRKALNTAPRVEKSPRYHRMGLKAVRYSSNHLTFLPRQLLTRPAAAPPSSGSRSACQSPPSLPPSTPHRE